MCGTSFVNTVYGRQSREFRPVGNRTRQGSITSEILLNFYINEILDNLINLPIFCCLNCSEMNILCYADDIVLLASTVQALQVLLDSLSDTIRTLLLTINVQKSCHILFWHKNSKIFSDVKIYNQILKTVTECKYLGVGLSDGLSYKDVRKS